MTRGRESRLKVTRHGRICTTRQQQDMYGEVTAGPGECSKRRICQWQAGGRISFLRIFAAMKHEVIIKNIADLDRAAKEFLEKIGDNTLVAFYAPMGSGKTTFTTALCRVLGVTDPVGSPTFAIVNEYMCADGDPMYHFDFYRINRLSEAIEIGLYDYLDSGCLCIMEWPENIEELLPEETLKVTIAVNPDNSRTLSWETA